MKVLSTSLNQKQNGGFYKITHGIDVDQSLYKEELQVQKAWVEALASINVLSAVEEARIIIFLDSLASDMEKNVFSWRVEDEDIHMNIERAVTEKLGDLGKKMHLGRSRNDLIATTMKLYLKNSASRLSEEAIKICNGLMANAERDLDIIVPGYTHYQAAQPIRMSHVWNFHALNFASDVKRLFECAEKIMDIMPLGSGAISGTHLSIDLRSVSKTLGFKNPPINSLHGVSDRDAILDYSHALSIFALHIVRLCDDVIFWSSSPLGILKLSSDWSSGSSMMPNKRNPDFFEIIRAKFKKISLIANEMILLNHGFISGYASDFHEQKRVIITTIIDVQEILLSLPLAVQSLSTHSQIASKHLLKGHILATDLANEMVDSGIPFRNAYSKIAEEITLAESNDEQVGLHAISFIEAVEKRNNFGGTSRKRVEETIAFIRDFDF